MALTQSPWDATYANRRKRPAQETRTFTDEASGYAITLTLEALDELTIGVGNDLYVELVDRYVTGGASKKPQVLTTPTVPPTRVAMSRDLCQKLAMLRAMERPGPEHPKGTEWKGASDLDWIGLATVFPDLWREILVWANTLGVEAGNASTAATSDTTTS